MPTRASASGPRSRRRRFGPGLACELACVLVVMLAPAQAHTATFDRSAASNQNGAGSGSSVGLFGVRAFTLSQQKRRAESRRSVRPALSELFVCGAASDPDALRYRP